MSLPDLRSEKINSNLWRAADIRGVAGIDLTEAAAETIGRAFGTKLRRRGDETAIVGGDGRQSTPALKSALIKGLLSTGITVTDIGFCPTPMLYFAVRQHQNAGGVMVTASHNPKEYNGFKLVVDNAVLCGDKLNELKDQIDCGDFETGSGFLQTADFKDAFISRLLKDFPETKTNLSVVWDCGNGTAGFIVPDLIKKISGAHTVIHAVVDGNFPSRSPDCSKIENLSGLRQEIMRQHADFGFAFDGDSDRLSVLDDKGEMIPTDHLLQIFAEDILRDFPNAAFVGDIKCSKTFFMEIERMGGRAVVSKTGHSFVKEKMAKKNAVMGGEMSGHICFADRYYGYDDAFYAALRLIKIVTENLKGDLKSRLNQIPVTFATDELTFPCPDDLKAGKIEKIKQKLIKKHIPFDTTDGIKVVFPTTGWWLLRASNTSPALVGRCEADSEKELSALKKDLQSYL